MSTVTPPSVADFELFLRLYEEVRLDAGRSLRQIAARLGVVPGTLSNLLRELERFYGLDPKTNPLIEREVGRSEPPKLLEAAHALARKAQTFLDEYRGCRQWLNPRAVPSRLRIGISGAIFELFLIGKWLEGFFAAHPHIQVQWTSRDSLAVARDVDEGKLDLGIVYDLLNERPREARRLRDVEYHYFHRADQRRVEFGRLFICHPDHRFAREINSGERKAVSIGELDSAVLCYRPYALERALKDLPPADPARGGGRIELPGYHDVLAFVRQNLGVGVVPAVYWVMDDLRERGQLVYAPLEGAMPVVPLCVLPKSPTQSEVVADFLERLRRHLEELPQEGGWGRRERLLPEPEARNYQGYRHAYFVGRGRDSDAPCWYCGELRNWKAKAPPRKVGQDGGLDPKVIVAGLLRDFDGSPHRHKDYRLEGRVFGNEVFTLVGQSSGDAGGFGANFNSVTPEGHLIGTWTGYGPEHNPWQSIGVMILTEEPIVADSPEEVAQKLWDITRCGSQQRLLNATEGGDSLLYPLGAK